MSSLLPPLHGWAEHAPQWLSLNLNFLSLDPVETLMFSALGSSAISAVVALVWTAVHGPPRPLARCLPIARWRAILLAVVAAALGCVSVWTHTKCFARVLSPNLALLEGGQVPRTRGLSAAELWGHYKVPVAHLAMT